jgi:hypothetical protein
MPTTRYLRIAPLGGLVDLKADSTGRAMLAYNFLLDKKPSETVIEELASVLVAAGVGVANSNIFGGSQARIPDGAGPFLLIIETPGAAPGLTQNEPTTVSYEKPSVQIIVRAGTYAAARTMVKAAFNAFTAVKNRDVSF